MVGGGSDLEETSNRLGLPAELIGEAEGFRDSDEGIYQDNYQTVRVFNDMQTQWRVGPCGPTGFDYGVFLDICTIRQVEQENREDVFEGLQVMEQAALKVFRERRES